MKVTVEQKKIEALKRMRMLEIFPQTVKQFEKADYVSISEPPYGAFYWAEGKDLEAIRNFEKEYNALIYVVIRSFTHFGKIDSFLFVSDHEEEWEKDREDILEKQAIAYCNNLTMPDCSELGYIGFANTVAAGLERTW